MAESISSMAGSAASIACGKCIPSGMLTGTQPSKRRLGEPMTDEIDYAAQAAVLGRASELFFAGRRTHPLTPMRSGGIIDRLWCETDTIFYRVVFIQLRV